MLAATDPAAVIATFKRLVSPRRLATLVEAESLFNDGTGIVAFTIAVGWCPARPRLAAADRHDLRLGRGGQRRDRGGDRLGGIASPPQRRRPPDRDQPFRRAGIRHVPGRRRAPPVRRHRHLGGGDRARQLRPAPRAVGADPRRRSTRSGSSWPSWPRRSCSCWSGSPSRSVARGRGRADCVGVAATFAGRAIIVYGFLGTLRMSADEARRGFRRRVRQRPSPGTTARDEGDLPIAGCTSSTGPGCAGPFPRRWRSRCRPTCRTVRCCRGSRSASSSSRCWSRRRRPSWWSIAGAASRPRPPKSKASARPPNRGVEEARTEESNRKLRRLRGQTCGRTGGRPAVEQAVGRGRTYEPSGRSDRRVDADERVEAALADRLRPRRRRPVPVASRRRPSVGARIPARRDSPWPPARGSARGRASSSPHPAAGDAGRARAGRPLPGGAADPPRPSRTAGRRDAARLSI
jgi:hypothetical protein